MKEDHGYPYREIKQTVYSGVSLPSVTWRRKARQQGDKLRYQPHEALPGTMNFHHSHVEPLNLQDRTYTYSGSSSMMSCPLSEMIVAVDEIKLFIADKNNKLHSGSEICPLRLDRRGKEILASKVACMGRGELATCLPPL